MKETLFPIIEENFTTLLRAGAFDITGTQLQPMSAYKWSVLQALAKELRIEGIIASGIRALKDDVALPRECISNTKEEVFGTENVKLYNIFTSRKLKKIKDEERHSMDTSIETLDLLDIIVANADEIITNDMSLIGIISLGRYLRTQGHRVDFVKLNNWIDKLGIKQITSFLCSMLIELFDFEVQELEFMNRRYVNPMIHYRRQVQTVLAHKVGFRSVSRLNIALLETTSYHLGRLKQNITNIEE